jgi:3-oxoacyl-[acyl-carrier-protein] synthase II
MPSSISSRELAYPLSRRIMATSIPEPALSSSSRDPRSQSLLRVAPRGRTTAVLEVVVTGIGLVLPNADTRERLWEHLSQGASQLAIERDPGDGMDCAIGRVRDFECSTYLPHVPPKLYASCHREQQLYLASLVRAADDAALGVERLQSERVGLYDGTSRGCFAAWLELAERRRDQPGARFSLRELNLLALPGQAVGIAAAILKIKGPTYTFNGTCASGAIAVGHAFHELQAGRIDVALATGHDVALVGPVFQMYRDAGLLSAEACDPRRAIRPFSGNSANAFGEGAVTLVLETRSHAEARKATGLAELVAYRYGNGGDHPTDVDFTGERPARLIGDALGDAQIGSDVVDFVVGHGNGVPVSDISELNYMKRVFGRRTSEVPLISTKPIYGHTFGASSALNVAAAALMLHHDFIVPTVGVDEARVVHGFNHQANRGSARELSCGLAVSYGIGGQNAAVVLRKAEA